MGIPQPYGNPIKSHRSNDPSPNHNMMVLVIQCLSCHEWIVGYITHLCLWVFSRPSFRHGHTPFEGSSRGSNDVRAKAGTNTARNSQCIKTSWPAENKCHGAHKSARKKERVISHQPWKNDGWVSMSQCCGMVIKLLEISELFSPNPHQIPVKSLHFYRNPINPNKILQCPLTSYRKLGISEAFTQQQTPPKRQSKGPHLHDGKRRFISGCFRGSRYIYIYISIYIYRSHSIRLYCIALYKSYIYIIYHYIYIYICYTHQATSEWQDDRVLHWGVS